MTYYGAAANFRHLAYVKFCRNSVYQNFTTGRLLAYLLKNRSWTFLRHRVEFCAAIPLVVSCCCWALPVDTVTIISNHTALTTTADDVQMTAMSTSITASSRWVDSVDSGTRPAISCCWSSCSRCCTAAAARRLMQAATRAGARPDSDWRLRS